MTHQEKGHFANKHAPDRKVDDRIVKIVKERSSNEEIPCAAAFDIANDLKVSPEEVGFTIDSLEIHIVKCQLGLHGYQPDREKVKPADSVPSELEKAIREALVDDRLPCAVAWEIAKRFDLPKMEVSSACEALKIKVSSCQLGTF